MNGHYEKDLDSLLKIADQQNDQINLSTILITTKCGEEDLNEILSFFSTRGIEVINEDVEPECDFDVQNNTAQVSPFDPSKIDIKMDKITVDSIIKRIKNEELEFDSTFQRKAGLWKPVQKSRLIESILLKIPLPAFYFDASNDDKWQIIDGLQRIGTIKEYVVDQSFKLNGLEFLHDLDGVSFDGLPRPLQRRIEETNLNAYLVNPATPINVKFNIFKRINTGGLVLEPQEIRNALFQGQAAQFLLDCSKSTNFKKATDYSIKSDRMLDREFILRFVCFTNLDLEIYNGIMDDFLNSGMEYIQKASAKELDRIASEFERVMIDSNKILGKYAFRKIVSNKKRGPVNKALYEVWSVLVKKLSNAEVLKLCAQRERLLMEYETLCSDYNFINVLKAADKNSVKTRFLSVQKIVEGILND